MNKINKFLITSIIFIVSFISPYVVDAATFSDASYKDAQDYNIVATKVLAESNQQSLEFFQMVSKWETNNINETEQYKDLNAYVEKSKERYKFVYEYNSSLVKELQKTYESYCNDLDTHVNGSVNNFTGGRVIFIDYIENNLSETQSNYLSFKSNGLKTFLDAKIFTTHNKLAINKILNGSESDKNDGINSLNETITELKAVCKDSKTPVVIRNYAQAYINHYEKLIKGDTSDTEYLIGYERDRINGLIPVGSVFYEIEEFNNYVQLFDNFTDYPTLELSLNLKASTIKNAVETICDYDIKTKNVQKLKYLHYNYLYHLNEYKKSNDLAEVTKAYDEFYNYYNYLNSYYNRVNQRFAGFGYNDVTVQMTTLKENIKCINPNFESINNLTYVINTSTDSNSYREFIIHGANSINIIKIVIIIGAVIVLVAVIVLIIKKKNKYNNYDSYNSGYNYYNSYNNNYDDYYYDEY